MWPDPPPVERPPVLVLDSKGTPQHWTPEAAAAVTDARLAAGEDQDLADRLDREVHRLRAARDERLRSVFYGDSPDGAA